MNSSTTAPSISSIQAASVHTTPDASECSLRHDSKDQIRGSLMGGAVGDALGAAVEFIPMQEIKSRFGPGGISKYATAYGRVGAITDDTQMTLFTAEGLLHAYIRGRLRGMVSITSVICSAYLRWLHTQGLKSKSEKSTSRMVGWFGGRSFLAVVPLGTLAYRR